jgi:hypothetical protein
MKPNINFIQLLLAPGTRTSHVTRGRFKGLNEGPPKIRRTSPRLSDRLCGLAVRVLGYKSGGPGSIPGSTRKKKRVVGLERGPLSLVSTTEEQFIRKIAAPV